MGNDVMEWCASLAECFIIVRFVNRWLPVRSKRYQGCAAGVLFGLLALDNIGLSQREGTENLSILIMLALIFVYSLALQTGRIYEKIFEVLIPTLTLFPINGLVLYAASFLTKENVDALRSSGGELRVMVLFFSKFAFFLICELLIQVKRKERDALLSIQWILQLICFLISFYIANLIWSISRQAHIHSSDMVYAFLAIAVLNIVLFILLARMESSRRLREDYNLATLNLDMQKQFIEDAQRNYQQTKLLQHDMKHYFMTAAGLIEDGNPEEAKRYLETAVHTKLSLLSSGIQTGAPAVDAVLNAKISACREQGIDIKTVINTEFQEMDEMDMSILLSNLLDNAMRGCQDTDAPRIYVEIARQKSNLQIIVENNIRTSVLADNPSLHTTKPEQSEHGYGMASIRAVSDRYGGSVSVREEGGLFLVEVCLDLN